MFADDDDKEIDQNASDADDAGKTVAMNGEEKEKPKKPAKKAGDWVTAEMSKAPKPEAKSPAPATPAASSDEWADAGSAAPKPSVSAPAPAAGAPAPVQPEAAMGSSPQGGIWGLMSQIGIKDANAQKWVLGVVIGIVVLCCACACLIGILYATGAGGNLGM
jgi:hypothetical protein